MRASFALRALLLALLIAAPASLRALNPVNPIYKLPPAQPGAVLTVTVPLPPQAQNGTARFMITPTTQVRLFGDAGGTLEIQAGEVAYVPLTVALSREQESGPLTVASIAVQWPDGTLWSTEVMTDVLARRRVQVGFAPESRVVIAGQAFSVTYTVANLGNGADSINMQVAAPAGWRVNGVPGVRALARGETMTGRLQVTPSRDARNEGYPLTLFVRTLSDTAVANAIVQVGSGAAQGSAFTRLPLNVFVGVPDARSPIDADNLDVGINGETDLNARTTVGFSYRTEQTGGAVPGFARHTLGYGLSARLLMPGLEVQGGDLMGAGAGLSLRNSRALGITSRWQNDTYSATLLFGRPRTPFDPTAAGHMIGASAGVRTAAGTFSINVADYEQPGFVASTMEQSRRLSLGYLLNSGAHQLTAEAGWVGATGTSSGDVAGMAIDGEYRYGTGRRYFATQLRHVPANVPLAQGSLDRLGFSFGAPLTGSLGVVGWANAMRRPGLGGEQLGSRQATGGLTYSSSVLRAGVRGAWESRDGASAFSDFDQYSVATTASIALGMLSIDANVELGEIHSAGGHRPMSAYSATARLQSHRLSAFASTNYGEAEFGITPWSASAGGELRLGALQLSSGVTRYLQSDVSQGSPTVWWAGSSVDLGRFTVVGGADFRPWLEESPVRFSFGVRSQIRVPVPTLPAFSISGVVFDDRNANGVRDADEPALPNIAVRLAGLQVVTDANGRYRFIEPAERGRPYVDGASLPDGFIPAPAAAETQSRTDIAVLRVTRLSIRVVEGSSAAGGAGVGFTLVDQQGRERSGITDDEGTFSFAALPPGSYTLTVRPFASSGAAMAPVTTVVEMPHGQDRSVQVAIPSRTPEIRFRNSPSGS